MLIYKYNIFKVLDLSAFFTRIIDLCFFGISVFISIHWKRQIIILIIMPKYQSISVWIRKCKHRENIFIENIESTETNFIIRPS